jgi:hypothetical protein
MLQHGLGVERNLIEAHKWLNLASAQQEPKALEARTELEVHMSESELQQAQAQAREWLASHSPIAPSTSE